MMKKKPNEKNTFFCYLEMFFSYFLGKILNILILFSYAKKAKSSKSTLNNIIYINGTTFLLYIKTGKRKRIYRPDIK